ncbi:hypothetical protein PPSIR1_27033, partial [Plesiocystis pacifica SIR-1]
MACTDDGDGSDDEVGESGPGSEASGDSSSD